MLKLVTTFYLNKKLKQQAIQLASQKQVGYGCDIKVKKEQPAPQPAKVKKIASFAQRLANSPPKTKGYYDKIIEYCVKHNLKITHYRHKVKFYTSTKTVVNLYFTHKTLRLCLALNPNDFDCSTLKFRDFSAYKKHQETPMSVLINSNKSVENSKILIFKAINSV